MRSPLELRVNGAVVRLDVDADRTLLSVLRDDLGLTGAKYGCGEGQCGACAVLVNGEPAHACLARVGALAGHEVVTVEGLEHDGQLHPVQQAFLDHDALQCGYCTSGMVVEGVALLRRNNKPSRQEIVEAMDGHICRCGTYQRIIHALQAAAATTKGATR